MDTGALSKLPGILRGIRQPLALGGLCVLVLYAVYDKILDLPIFANLDAGGTADVIKLLMGYLFWLAIVAVVLGAVGYLWRPAARPPATNPPPTKKKPAADR